MAFTHLHVHTEYSLLDGANKIKNYIARVKELGMDACAITDHGVMYGCIDFYKEAKAQGIKPIMGCEVYVAPGSRFDKESAPSDDRYYHLVLLAENQTGFENLTKIVSAGFTEGFYYRPRVDKEVLAKYHEGIIALSACLAGEVARNLTKNDIAAAEAAALSYEEIFGRGNFFLELQDHGIPEQKHVNRHLVQMHEETGIPLVATNDIHYTNAEDWESHDILLCIQTQKSVKDEDRMKYVEHGAYCVKSPEEMARLFHYAPEAIENTEKIAARCNVEITFGERKLPAFDVPAGYDAFSYLKELCEEGLLRCYGEPTAEHYQRLNYELNTIREMGFVDYFLIVWDFIKYAKDHGIPVGPGRGSAAGSIVSYALNITELDPIRYSLLFERFLNPERVSMPDIDIDFDPVRRQEVIDYVVEKYGRDCVVQIITFGTMKARAAIKDVARALDFTFAESNEIAKMIPRGLNENGKEITIADAVRMNPDLRQRIETDERVRYLVEMAQKLEGLPRNASMHAAGVVIAGRPVVDYIPLALGKEGKVTTQYPMTTIEELGLLKMDFLGLRNLAVIQDTVELVNQKLPPAQKLDIQKIEMDDRDVMKMIGQGKCEGVFQLESAGMRAFMKQLQPQVLEDIIAGIALYRPGPMDFIPRYVNGKNNKDAISYDCPELKPILSETYGCIVYQEQVMQIVRDLGGYSLGRSDLVRRAMSKKKAEVMEKERQNFVYGNREEGVPGCIANGIREDVANRIFDEMTDFASYAFNKSHAAAYALVTYRTAYLKYHYPVEFMAALLTSVIGDMASCAEYLLHAREVGIRVMPPSVNGGEGIFTSEGENIRYGMYAIRDVGWAAADGIVAERKANGPYESLRDFIARNYGKDLNKAAIESLIKAGALDELPGTRKQKLLAYEGMVDAAAAEHKGKIEGQMSLFDMMSAEQKADFESALPAVGEFDKEEIFAFEKEVLGVYLSGHPLEEYQQLLKSKTTAVSTDFVPDEETAETVAQDGARAVIGGIIAGQTIKYTRTNKVMSFVTIEDLLGTVEVLVFPKVYERYRDILVEDNKVLIEGRVSAEDDRPSKLIADTITSFTDLPKELWLAFPDRAAYEAQREEVIGLLRETPGQDKVFIFLRSDKTYREETNGRGVFVNEALVDQLRGMLGEDSVTLR